MDLQRIFKLCRFRRLDEKMTDIIKVLTKTCVREYHNVYHVFGILL